MAGYIGNIPVPQGIQNKESFTATAAQTTFNTNGYTDGAFISVYLNGVRLVNGTDYTATNGSDVVLASAANTGDVLDFESFNSFSLASQQFENITTKNPTHEDTDGGRESALSFQGEQSGGEISTLAAIQASHDGTADDQKGDLIFKTNDGSDNNAPTERLRIDSDGSIVPATLGTSNVKLGLNAGKAISSGGNYNTVIGEEAGAALSTGDVNTFVGYQSGDATTTSGNNVGVGYASLTTNILSSKNVAIGNNALKTHNLGSAGEGFNVAVGHGAGEEITTGTQNTIIGGLAGDALTTGALTAVGYLAGSAATTSVGNVLMGELAGTALTTGGNNTAFGSQALSNATTTTDNTAIGHDALRNLSSGAENTAVGSEAGDALTVGNGNVAVGVQALSTDVVGSRSTAVGATALKVQQASGSTANNYYNVGLGYGAGLSLTTGYYNTLLGSFAGSTQTTAIRNTFVGYDCAGYVTTGGDNLAIGYKAGMYQTNLTTGSGACLVGPYCDPTDGTADYSHGLGYNLDCAGGYTTFGNGSSDIRAQHGSTTWSTVSDERYKKDIVDSTVGLSFINNLKPRTFNYKTLGELPDTFLAYEKDSTEVFKSDKTQHGFIAQEVKTAIDADNGIKNGFKFWDEREDGSQEVAEAALIPVLTKAIQELSAKVDALESENTAIKARLDALEAE